LVFVQETLMSDLCNTSKYWRGPGSRPAPLARRLAPLAPRAWRLDGDSLVGIACVAIIVAALLLL